MRACVRRTEVVWCEIVPGTQVTGCTIVFPGQAVVRGCRFSTGLLGGAVQALRLRREFWLDVCGVFRQRFRR